MVVSALAAYMCGSFGKHLSIMSCMCYVHMYKDLVLIVVDNYGLIYLMVGSLQVMY